jgi:hypothetical protein
MTIEDVDKICNYFYQLAVLPLRNSGFEQEWHNRNLNEPYYFSLAYFCVAAVLDNKSTSHVPDNLRSAIKVLEYIEEHDQDYHHGSVRPWARIGDARHALGDQRGEIDTCNRGIETLTRVFGWHQGDLLPFEKQNGNEYSFPEILHAQKGRSQLEISDFEGAIASFEFVLGSLRVRGITDYINSDFPKGLRPYISMAKNNQTTIIERQEPSAQAREYQKQSMSFVNMLSRIFGK